MKQAEDQLNLANAWPELPKRSRFRALPGRVAVLMCQKPIAQGSILLTDRTSGNLRPDAGVVAAVGEGIDLRIGDRVYVRPYVGLHVHTEEGTYRLLGRELFDGEDRVSAVPWWDHVVAQVGGAPAPSPI